MLTLKDFKQKKDTHLGSKAYVFLIISLVNEFKRRLKFTMGEGKIIDVKQLVLKATARLSSLISKTTLDIMVYLMVRI